MCSETDNDRKPSKAILWTQQTNQVRENTQAVLRKEPKLSSQVLAEELECGEGNKRHRLWRAVTESLGFTFQAPSSSLLMFQV